MNRKSLLIGLAAAGAMAAQSLSGPVMGYVVDGGARMRPLYGMPSAGHVGGAVREGVQETRGALALLADGTAMRGETALEGAWARLEPGAFVDESGRELLVAAGEGDAWRLTLPERALAVRVSASGQRVLTLLADESLAVWKQDGTAELRVNASIWWGIAFAGERAMGYDPAENGLFWLDGQGGKELVRKLEGEGGQYELAVEASGRYAVLRGAVGRIVPLDGGEIREVTLPEGSERLEAVHGGRAFLLHRNPGKPLWILDPSREDALLVVPAMVEEKGAEQ
jgi:hypothetical protein